MRANLDPKTLSNTFRAACLGQLVVFTFLLFWTISPAANAYVGPALGINLFGALIGIVSVVGLVLINLIKWLFRSLFKMDGNIQAETESSSGSPGLRAEETISQRAAYADPSKQHGRGLGLRVAYIFLGMAIAVALGLKDEVLIPIGLAIHHVSTRFGEPVVRFHTVPARFPADKSGVVTYDKAAAYPGRNIELSAGTTARLLDMEGNELHRWELHSDAISRAWLATGRPLWDLSGLFWRRVKPLPDGSLLVVLEQNEGNPYGMGMIKLDWDSRVQWMAPKHYHHSIDLAPDGRIYTLFQEMTAPPVAGVGQIESPFLNEGIAVLSPSGEEIERIGIIDAFRDTPFESFLHPTARPNFLG